jgi:CRISPR-associated protein Cas2
MERRRYLVSYDISDDKRRTTTFNTLRNFGDHAQYSVFICELTNRELAQLRGLLTAAVHAKEDQVLILDLGKAASPLTQLLECIGKPYAPPTICRVF